MLENIWEASLVGLRLAGAPKLNFTNLTNDRRLVGETKYLRVVLKRRVVFLPTSQNIGR